MFLPFPCTFVGFLFSLPLCLPLSLLAFLPLFMLACLLDFVLSCVLRALPCNLDRPWTHAVAQAGLEPADILLLKFSEYQGYVLKPPCLPPLRINKDKSVMCPLTRKVFSGSVKLCSFDSESTHQIVFLFFDLKSITTMTLAWRI